MAVWPGPPPGQIKAQRIFVFRYPRDPLLMHPRDSHAPRLSIHLAFCFGGLMLLLSSAVHAAGDEVVEIDSLQALAEYAKQSNVSVRLKPGEYRIDDDSLIQTVEIPGFRAGKPQDKPKRAATLFHFSGNRSHYDLTDTTILFNNQVKASKAFAKIDQSVVFVSGNGNTIHRLTVLQQGDQAPAHRGTAVVVIGDQNTLSDADLLVTGSYPYGYGHLLGKGGGAIVKHHKYSGILIAGKKNTLDGVKLRQHAYGHGIFMQGAVDTLIKDCYVEGEVRSTNDMLAETRGPAFDAGFKSLYPPGRIVPDQMKSLAEDGIRTYPAGGMVSTRTERVTVIGCTIVNMRSGVCFGFEKGPSKIIDTTSTGHQERGFSIGSNGVIKNCKGDAANGPLLTFLGPKFKNATIDLQIIDTLGPYPVPRVLEINGTGHQISLKNADGKKRQSDTPIVFGASEWEDIKYWRAPDSKRSQYSGAYDCIVRNETGLPILLTDLTRDNKILTNGKIVRDKGKNNQIKQRR